MSYSKPRSQEVHHDLRESMKIKYHPSRVLQVEQNGSKMLKMQMGSPKRTNEIPNTQEQGLCSSKKTRQDLTTLPTKIINITLGINPKTCMHYFIQEDKGSLYEAVSTLDPVKREIERQPGKEMLVCGIKGIEGYINLGMPLRCFPEGCHVLITFSKTEHEEKENNEVCGRFDQSPAECVVFYIHAVGNREQRILRCRELHNEGTKLCVYGFNGETIKTTLRKDGRFDSFVESAHWKLITNDTTIANTQPVDVLQGKLFQIDVERKENPWVALATQKSELEDRTFSELKGYIVNLYPTLKRECEKMRAFIKEESENSKQSLFKAHKKKFRELTKNSTPGETIKLLSQFLDSTGLIVWDNNGNRGSATCFVFGGLYIFTCRHVLNDIVGEGKEPLECIDLISQCVRVTFDDEDCKEPNSNCNNCFCIEPSFVISDVTLDYAVLKLKENCQQVPAGLYNGIATALPSELTFMIGYENGQKVIDRCTVIPQGKLKEKNQQCVRGTEVAGHSHSLKYILMNTKRSFQKMIDKPNDFTYNTFYCGSSGSPIFDCKGSLVAMHTAGFICEHESGVYDIIEFGTRMESILNHIKQKHKEWYNEVCVNQQDVEMCSGEAYINDQDVEMYSEPYINPQDVGIYSGAYINQQDIEMCSVEI
ncbi:serine protease FAM111A [Mesocricetus auratus]|uniref:Protein FAM111A-like n=1 Tax=Mesocricetus auratus TaxID=10036 RepID=A0A1U8BSG5_MESAU|nr:serine protease FAM111A [Mesocricetus auratus]XP_021081277.1 serine protease FAM111A [Mesocricetus auratus]XP_040602940.1 serine protease FAM111A [Mesocricetus auratus]XP_040602947.1 serine protease FAM111A [Mesocricetus auratus]XP_040602950.1 serine protease FAM111A [Mesocricetus auratus]